MTDLQNIIQRIVNVADPIRIVLFGSRARGDHQSDSDWDFLVIQNSDLPRYKRAAPIRRAIAGLLISKDIVVYTPGEVDDWADVPNAFVTKALAEGKVLYEKKPK